jgi:hypothetical protein
MCKQDVHDSVKIMITMTLADLQKRPNPYVSLFQFLADTYKSLHGTALSAWKLQNMVL